MLKTLTIALTLACAGAAYAGPSACSTDTQCEAMAKPMADRLEAFAASNRDNPCGVQSGECEERAASFGIPLELLEAIDACEESEGEDDDACAIVDSYMMDDKRDIDA